MSDAAAPKSGQRNIDKLSSPNDGCHMSEEAKRPAQHAPAPRVAVSACETNRPQVRPDSELLGEWKKSLKNALGTTDQMFAEMLLHQLLGTVRFPQPDSGANIAANGSLAAIQGIAPRDETEAMLAVQMVAIHGAAMECARLANRTNQPIELRQGHLSQLTKLSRSYAGLLEALNRHRGKGRQRIVVERVNVRDGGRAIVGAVDRGGRFET